MTLKVIEIYKQYESYKLGKNRLDIVISMTLSHNKSDTVFMCLGLVNINHIHGYEGLAYGFIAIKYHILYASTAAYQYSSTNDTIYADDHDKYHTIYHVDFSGG